MPFAMYIIHSVHPVSIAIMHDLFLRLGLALADFADGESWRQTLLQLLRLIRVLDHEGVEVPMAADLELDVLAIGRLLDACRGCILTPADLNELLDV